MQANAPRRDSLWRRIGRGLVLVVPLSAVVAIAEKSGVPKPLTVALLLLIPIAAAFVPRVALRWKPWGSSLCFVCSLCALLAAAGGRSDEIGVLSMLWLGLAMGLVAIVLEFVTGPIARRSASAS